VLVAREINDMGVFARMSGLGKLAEHYPATHEPGGVSQTRQTLKVGGVRYRRCVTVSIGPEGLFLWIRPPLGRAGKLLIPWDEIREVGGARLYGRQGVHMSIGDPEVGNITMYRELFERVRTYLGETTQAKEE
jgi:hypothetical protein